eukprot:TRINITY_DN8166_c0_g1_i1.p1 TRINITY_DN8166_c0_g1~~TRINITY_DN8166_c0_g1_i1.p1  ORF type:complete len:156 (+),score=3.93 TRINITY_DN8166_c0_g1_i1:24-491(+)
MELAPQQIDCANAPFTTFIEGNQVWNFMFVHPHRVRLGDYITCDCRGDLRCPYLVHVVGRIWGETVLKHISSYHLADATRMPKWKCSICHISSRWADRGSAFTYCGLCKKAYHRECLTTWVQHNKVPTCPLCRATDFLPTGHNIEMVCWVVPLKT